jgi:23S rRNA pseudoU1915 N3-methylase RlmH
MSNQNEFSYWKGYTFSFEDEGFQIEAWFSALSGLEKVFVDGEMVSSHRNLSANSTNTFKICDNEYSINMQAVSVFRGPFVCTLNKNGEGYKRQKLIFPWAKNIYREFLFAIGLGVVIGGAYGVAVTIWNSSNEIMYISLMAFLVAVLLIKFYPSNCKPIIEEVRIE